MLRTLLAFARPHTLGGTVLAVVVLDLLAAVAAGHHGWGTFATVLAASLAVNVYVVGLNQLADVAVDKVNKPELPLASGAMAVQTGRTIVAVCGVAALGMAAWQGAILLATIAAVAALGTAYSIPPFHLKKHPLAATGAITLARGVIANVGVYNAFAAAYGAPTGLPPNLLAFVAFLVVFVSVIGLMKDVPDLEGDAAHGFRTMAVRLGPKAMIRLGLGLLAVAYVAMTLAGLMGVTAMHEGVVVAGHAFGLLAVFALWWRTEPGHHPSTVACYRAIWLLFYFEFFCFGLGSLAYSSVQQLP